MYGVRIHLLYEIRVFRGFRKIFAAGIDFWADQGCSESLCKVNITGSLTKKVSNATISWNVTTHFNDGRVGQIPGIDNFYRWVNVFQNNIRTYHLQPGPALMNQSFLLLGGWVPVVSCVPYPTVFDGTGLEDNKIRQITVLCLTSPAMRGPGSAYALTGRCYCMDRCRNCRIDTCFMNLYPPQRTRAVASYATKLDV